MMLKNKYISILFCVSSGLNGENLGSDEHEIINICNIIIDVNNHKVNLNSYFEDFGHKKWFLHLQPVAKIKLILKN